MGRWNRCRAGALGWTEAPVRAVMGPTVTKAVYLIRRSRSSLQGSEQTKPPRGKSVAQRCNRGRLGGGEGEDV